MINIVENKQKDCIFVCVYKIIGIEILISRYLELRCCTNSLMYQIEKCNIPGRVAGRHYYLAP